MPHKHPATQTANGGGGPSQPDITDIGEQLNQMINELQDTGEDNGNMGFLPRRQEAELSDEERSFMMAVDRGDVAGMKKLLDSCAGINMNCVDPLGRNALHIAIENEHIEVLELLLTYPGIEMGDSLLHAINEEHLEAVEMLLNAQSEKQHRKNLSGLLGTAPSSSFTPDITPIILAAHRDNYEILKLLLDREDRIPKPHDLRCNCFDCIRARKEDSLCHSKSRINAYRALASPSLIALSSKDPILTSFELSWELRRMGKLENEFKTDYEELAGKCQKFATDLLQQTRGSDELEVILNHDVGQIDPTSISTMNDTKSGDPRTLSRLKLAIKYKQKNFVAHPHCQQLLASLWYEGLPGFRRRSFVFQLGMIGTISAMFPFLSFLYLFAPKSRLGGVMRKPFIKFLCHTTSYIMFLGFLILAAVRIEFTINRTIENRMKDRGPQPSVVEYIIIIYVMGFIWTEIKQLWNDGVKAYCLDSWNLLDFGTNSLYVGTIALRIVAYYRSSQSQAYAEVPRKDWNSFDPVLISECLFAAANIFSTLKLVYIFTLSPQLGPLQISLGRMLNDIVKFLCMLSLVIVAFACGLNQLYWFYANERATICHGVTFSHTANSADSDKYNYCTTRGRYFTNLFDILQSLYWATYGLIELTNFNLEYPHSFTEFVGKLMFGAYLAILVIVLLNMLIAMMNNSYEIIAKQADAEWKFSRTKLWISYFEEGGTLPVPFNIIPSPKSCYYFFLWIKNLLFGCMVSHKKSQWKSIRNIVRKVNEKEARYQSVMRDLIKRYLMHRQKSEDDKGVTEDDLNEIKGDISSFRYELLEILRMNGMKTPVYADNKSGKGKLRRKNSRKGGLRLNNKKMDVDPIPEEENDLNDNNTATDNTRRRRVGGDTNSASSYSLNSAGSIDDTDSGCWPTTPVDPNGGMPGQLKVPTGRKSNSTPELMLDARRLVHPPTASPFNAQTGMIKKVSFNWQQETKEKSGEDIEPNIYVYDGSVTDANSAPSSDKQEDAESKRSDLV